MNFVLDLDLEDETLIRGRRRADEVPWTPPPLGQDPEDDLLPDLPRLTGLGKGVGKEERGKGKEGGGESLAHPPLKRLRPPWRKCSLGNLKDYF